MNNILVVTPMFRIEGRNELIRDSEAVYYLIKEWKNRNVFVINAYINGLRHIGRFIHSEQINYYRNGYYYECDNIPVLLIERQNIIPCQIDGLKFQGAKYKKIIESNLKKRNFTPNKIVVHMPSTSKFFLNELKYNCSKIAVLHNTDLRYLKKNEKSFTDYLENTFDMVFARSKSIYEEAKRYKIKNLKKEIISSGVDNVKINDNNKTFHDKGKWKILYVGKLIKRKKLDVLIKSLNNIKEFEWELKIVGKGPEKKNYERLIKKLNLHSQVEFLGNIQREQVFEYMEKSDVFCMPSVNETLGLVYLEAMSAGCITIGTKNEGIDGIIQNEKNGFLTSPNDINDLERILRKIFEMEKKDVTKISENAMSTAQYYNSIDMSNRYLNLIENGEKDGKL